MSWLNYPSNAVEWQLFDDAASMARRVADDIQSIARSAIEARGSAILAMPGGRTPVPIFHELARRALEWSLLTLVPTDDRLVPSSDPLSNAGLIGAYFGGTDARLLPLYDGKGGVRAAGRSADKKLRTLHWPLDLVWLGMGEDGHTASILPGPDWDTALNGLSGRRACGVTPDPLPADAPVARVTLTRDALVASRSMMLTITGKAMREVAMRAIKDGSFSALAIGRVLASARVPVNIYWSR